MIENFINPEQRDTYMTLRVVELFAGVGGFRLGLEGPPGSSRQGSFKVVWSNQWEPSTKKQHAAETYVERWNLQKSDDNPLIFHGDGETFVNEDISKIDSKDIPEHDLLVGGFPCQDYSVARTSASGLEGKKGVLWWEILRIITDKRPKYVMLENVDRLLKSPTSQRGRDFAVMLASLDELDYVVEWRVINAADYGMPQRRRRVFILAYAPGTSQHEALSSKSDILGWIEREGVHAQAFPIHPLGVLVPMSKPLRSHKDADLANVSNEFNVGANPKSKSTFMDAGVMVDGQYYTYKSKPNFEGERTVLSDILLSPSRVALDYCIEPDSVFKGKGWKYLKGAKEEPRKGTGNFTYLYKEGPMIFPDALDRPSRTIITGEGGATASRFKHVVKFRPTKKMREVFNLDSDGVQLIRKELRLKKSEWIRRLTPIELERLNMFPDNHTSGTTDTKRAFFMGNALVVGIVERIGERLTMNYEGDELSPSTIISKIISGHRKGLEKMNKELEEMGLSQGLSVEGDIQQISKIYHSNKTNKKQLRDSVSEPIRIFRGLELWPALKYSGTQAINAYHHAMPRKNWKKSNRYKNAGRKFVGLLDFLIIDFETWNEDGGKMNHEKLLREILTKLDADIVREIYHGSDLNSLGIDEEAKNIALQLMCAFVEQEVNWGTENFQKHTNFGNTEYMYLHPDKCKYLQEAVPRDFYCSHILYLFDQLEQGAELETLLTKFIKKNKSKTSPMTKPTIMPAIDGEHIRDGYGQFMLSYQNKAVTRWIEPFLDEVDSLCKIAGENHLWEKRYSVDDSGGVVIKDECPKEGEDWPKILLR